MSDAEITKAELIRRIDEGYKALQQLLSTWTDEQLVTPGGPDGWSVKDHLAHLATWERGQAAMLRREDRWKTMGVDLDFAVNAKSVEDINDRYYAQTHNKSLDEIRAMFADAHQQLLRALDSLTEADLFRPYGYFQPEEPGEDDGRPMWFWLAGNSYEHYEEHTPWMKEVIANPKSSS